MNKKAHFECGYPITFYLLLVGLLVQGVALASDGSIGKVLFYSSCMFLFFYMLLLRFTCRLKIKDNILEVIYAFPWDKNIVIDLSNVESIGYAKGFYDIFSKQSIGGLYVFPKYCYDELIIALKGEDELLTLKINTRFNKFDQGVSVLKKLVA